MTAAFSTSFSSTMTSIVAFAAAVEIGLPPKVEMFPPFQESAMAVVARTAPIGMAVGDALGHRHDVGLDAVVVLDAPHLAAGAAEARLHLVADEDAAVLADDVDATLKSSRRGA